MDDFDGFVKAVLSHWFWLVAALVSFVASAKINFEDYKPRVALIVVGTVCLIATLYLALNDQYRALNNTCNCPNLKYSWTEAKPRSILETLRSSPLFTW